VRHYGPLDPLPGPVEEGEKPDMSGWTVGERLKWKERDDELWYQSPRDKMVLRKMRGLRGWERDVVGLVGCLGCRHGLEWEELVRCRERRMERGEFGRGCEGDGCAGGGRRKELTRSENDGRVRNPEASGGERRRAPRSRVNGVEEHFFTPHGGSIGSTPRTPQGRHEPPSRPGRTLMPPGSQGRA